MADVQYRPLGTEAAPADWTLPSSIAFTLKAARASFDGSGAASAWLPALEVISDAGDRVGLYPTPTSVAAGASADVSFFPWSRHHVAAGGVTYAERIIILKSQYTCVDEWQLDEGSDPWADTSGYNPADPATMHRQVRVIAMTQNDATGPLSTAPAGPSVAFNFDGTSLTNTGDFLLADGTADRSYFLGNLPFTVVAWVLPGAGVNTHEGPVVSTVHVTGFGAPGAHDDGWMLDVSQPDLIPKFRRYSDVQSGNNPDTAAGPTALPTNHWTMLVGTYDGATLKLYVNGLQVSSASSAGAIGGSANSVRIALGTINQGNTSTWYYGACAQISVWAATFTATDVLNLYTAGTS